MRIYQKILLIIFAVSFQLQSQELAEIPFDNSPIIDGTFSMAEWENSKEVSLVVSNNEEYRVLFSHDGENFNAIFIKEGSSTSPKFPEIMFDTDNDKSSNWMIDDWWFHVSATLCEYRGEPQNYDNCDNERPNWNASKMSDLSIVEMQIPFSTLEVDYMSDTIGIAFDVTNTFNSWNYWPENADINTPSTWANAYFQSNANSIETENSDEFTILPNPVDEILKIKTDFLQFEIFNLNGEKLISGESSNIDVSALERGIYFINIISSDQESFYQFIKI